MFHARIGDAPDVHVEEALIYRFDADSQLSRLASVERIVAQNSDLDQWILVGAYDWAIDLDQPPTERISRPLSSRHFYKLPFELARHPQPDHLKKPHSYQTGVFNPRSIRPARP